ncbi:MAG: hypothetical protein WAV45_04085 [Propionibacteriaceae bacterium]|nr:hypothetical protein [Micropruina sp.]HBX81433.1 hypothetical protein [Propionibacteriaceae bacterium]HBY23919.1 hypothetical protein [Propionibacteriaceae bacterium]
MSTVLALAPRLAVARIRNSRGGMMLDALAVAAFSICTALVLTVAGGAWMFVQRRMNPTQAMADALGGGSMSNLGDSPSLYVFLACLACGLLVVPILTLGGGAARLGAQGRARRLASLRLLGVTGGEVTLMAALESLVQAGIGAVIGSLLYLVTLPAWGGVSFEGVHIGAGEMLLPAWAWLGLIGLVLLLAGLSALFGLQGVRISPLGVAKRQTPPALRAWRAALLFAALVVYVITALGMRITNIEWGMYLTLLAMLGMMLLVINLVGPYILQTLARLWALSNRPAGLIAARRIVDDPRAAWRNVGALSTLSLAAAFSAWVPLQEGRASWAYVIIVADLRRGVLITLGIGFVLAACATTIAQASSVFDRRQELVALDRMGAPRSLVHATRTREVLLPEAITAIGSAGIGTVMSLPFVVTTQVQPTLRGIVIVGVVMVMGFALAWGGSQVARPLVNHVLTEPHRRND